jgi:DNA-directed RNA polymerase specialized sigma24 family protein
MKKRKKCHEARFFTEPGTPKQRLYEALRAVFVDELKVREAAEKFGYTTGSLNVSISHFRAGKLGPFFIESKPGPKTRPKRDPVRETVINLRKKNLSIYDISRILKKKKHHLSPRSVWEILRETGFARLPRRGDEERPEHAKPEEAPRADRRLLNLSPGQTFDTQAAGLFLFLPDLVDLGIPRLVQHAGFPGTKAIPAVQSVLSIVALKLLGRERYSHVMDCCHDLGLGLFAGLNAIPKTTALTTYSYRLSHRKTATFLRSLVTRALKLEAVAGESINLDFHAIPHFGDESVLERHYVPRRGHAEKSILVCFAQDGDTRAFCYSNANIRKEDQADEVLHFAKFWKKSTGAYPKELVFDSRFTTIEKLNELNRKNISFITLRTKGRKLVADLMNLPKASWESCTLDVPHRKYRNPRYYESRVMMQGYDKKLRQIAVLGLGRESPTIIITNHKHTKAVKSILTRYAQRMAIENAIADGVHFFHLDALCSSLNIQVDSSVALTVMSDLLYHRLARRITGYEDATAKQLYRKFINSTGGITIKEKEIIVKLKRRAHNPLLMAAGFGKQEVRVPWLGRYVVRFAFA